MAHAFPYEEPPDSEADEDERRISFWKYCKYNYIRGDILAKHGFIYMYLEDGLIECQFCGKVQSVKDNQKYDAQSVMTLHRPHCKMAAKSHLCKFLFTY